MGGVQRGAGRRLGDIGEPSHLNTNSQVQDAIKELTGMIQDTIRTTVLLLGLISHTKRWWSDELTNLKKQKNKSSESYKYSSAPSHLVHEQHSIVRN